MKEEIGFVFYVKIVFVKIKNERKKCVTDGI